MTWIVLACLLALTSSALGRSTYSDDHGQQQKLHDDYEIPIPLLTKTLPVQGYDAMALASQSDQHQIQVLAEGDLLCRGQRAETVIPLENGRKFIVCLDDGKGVEQSCPKGLFYRPDSRRCERRLGALENPCNSQPCLNGGQCLQTDLSYQCLCVPGFDGRNCELDARVCQSQQPCAQFPDARCQSFRLNAALPYICILQDGLAYGLNAQQATPSPCQGVDGPQALLVSEKGFIMCDGERMFVESCPGGTVWDDLNKACARPDMQNPILQSYQRQLVSELPVLTPASKVPTVPVFTRADLLCRDQQAETVIPLGDAHKFIICLDDGKGVEQSCPKGLFYHNDSRRCERKLDSLGNPCSSQPCLNDGQCVQTDVLSYECQCPPGFHGKICKVDVKVTRADLLCRDQQAETVIPLENGGKFIVCLDDGKGVEQSCPKGLFYGPDSRRCERKLGPLENSCNSQPCLNSGQCIPTEWSYQCHCPPGFDGKTCDLDLKAAQADLLCRGQRAETVIPLKDGRKFVVCLDDGKGIEQSCPKGLFYHSRRCERRLGPLENSCNSQPCLNSGQCIPAEWSYQCQCAPGFDGRNCELDARVCQSQQPCAQFPDARCQSFRLNAALPYICILQDGLAYGLNAEQATPSPCQGVDGTHALLVSEKGFIMCDGGRMFVESCPGGTVWDDRNKTCVWPDMHTNSQLNQQQDHEQPSYSQLQTMHSKSVYDIQLMGGRII